MTRYASRRDEAEKAIVAALRKAGALVMRLNSPCDLLVGYRRRFYLGEVKNPRVKLRADQREQQALRRAWSIPVWRTPEDALITIGAMTAGDTYKRLSAP